MLWVLTGLLVINLVVDIWYIIDKRRMINLVANEIRQQIERKE